MRLAVLCALALIAACGNITRKQEDGGVVRDDAAIDAMIVTPDAPLPTESREVVGGGGRLTGTTYTFEVQVGHGVSQTEATGATHSIEGNAAVKP